MVQLEIDEDGKIVLSKTILQHLGVYGEARLSVTFLSDKTIEVEQAHAAERSEAPPNIGNPTS